ncbi:MAG: trypsin [Actinobacteria bacterium HGW-Actinobacteria-1]|jgi:putative serine protease PepD|nr:MAG: trypsin [Actinobacteria bacterium HGW-Actinobacteria-1]
MTDEITPDEQPYVAEQTPVAYEPPPVAPQVAPVAPPVASPPRRRGGFALVLAGVFGGIIGAALVAAAFVFVLGFPVTRTTTDVAAETQEPVTAVAETSVIDTDANFAEQVASKLTPSVVNVAIEQTGIDRYTGKTVTQVVGNGSGVIIRADGYILTNNHVVEGADALIVTVGVEDLPAKVIGTDPSTDLAVIKVDKTGLPAAQLGSSAGLKVGEPVVAIGSPFGLEKTVTSGIISALGRSSIAQSASGITAYTSLIQTDASINPGNSGGALADANGKLIGINTLIQSTSGQSAGIGFAIPVDFAKSIADELISTGRASHPFMGVGTVTIDESVASQYDLPVSKGVLVQSIATGSPAEKAGITQGDIIVKIAGEDVASVEDVFTTIRSQKVGQTVSVEIVRGTEHKTLQVTLGSDTARQ